MDGLTVDRDEIIAATRHLSEAASTPSRPIGACADGSLVLVAIQRLSEAWARGHAVLVADATAARDTLLVALRAYAAADDENAARLRAIDHITVGPM